MNKLIDVHTHFLSNEYLTFLKEHNATLEDGFPLPSYNLDEHLQLTKNVILKNRIYLFLLLILILKDMLKNRFQCVGY